MEYIDISILIPCYNASKTIRYCLDSVLNQDYPKEKYKIYCIDDGSKDDTYQILQEYAKKFPKNIIVKTQENQGLAETRERLVKFVDTTYFLILDSDDFYLPNAFNLFNKYSNNGTNEIVVGKTYRYLTSDLKKRKTWWLTSHCSRFTNVFTYFLHNQPFAWNTLILTSFFKEVDIHWKKGVNLAEDNCIFSFLLSSCKKFKVIPKKTYGYVYYENSMSNVQKFNYENISQNLLQLDYFLQLVFEYNKKEIMGKKWNIYVRNFIYTIAMYLVATFFLFPKWNKYEKPSVELWIQTKNNFLSILGKYNLTLCSPKGWWKKLSYIFFFLKHKFTSKKFN